MSRFYRSPKAIEFRDIRVLEDGLIYLLTDDADGQLLRLIPGNQVDTE